MAYPFMNLIPVGRVPPPYSFMDLIPKGNVSPFLGGQKLPPYSFKNLLPTGGGTSPYSFMDKLPTQFDPALGGRFAPTEAVGEALPRVAGYGAQPWMQGSIPTGTIESTSNIMPKFAQYLPKAGLPEPTFTPTASGLMSGGGATGPTFTAPLSTEWAGVNAATAPFDAVAAEAAAAKVAPWAARGSVGTTGMLTAPLAGAYLGNMISGTSAGNEFINAGRGQSTNPLAQIAATLPGTPMPLVRGALELMSHLPGTSDFATNQLSNRTNSTVFDMLGTDPQEAQAAAAAKLQGPAISAKVDAANLSPEGRATFVKQYNDAIREQTDAGVPLEKAAQSTYDKAFGSVGADGAFTPGAISQFRAQDEAKTKANAATAEDAHRAVALQALMNSMGAQAASASDMSQAAYNAQMSHILPSLPGWLAPIAQAQQAQSNLDTSNQQAANQAFYQGIPQRQDAATQQKLLEAYQARLASQNLATNLPTPAKPKAGAAAPTVADLQAQAANGG